MLMLSIAVLAATPAPPAMRNEPDIVAAFMTLCRPGNRAAADVLADAAAQGWRGDGAYRAKAVAGGSLTLHATDQENHGERLQSCGIKTTASVPAIAAAAKAALGFAPALDLGTSATFFAIGDADGWRSGAAIDHAQFLAAKSVGKFYSIVASADETGSAIYDIRETPEQPTSAPR